MTQDQSPRDKILQRVMNLRALAENDGASEAEMNTAFQKAIKLMDAYGIEEAELAIAENEGRIVLDIVSKTADTSAKLGASWRHKVISTFNGIQEFTSTKIVYWRHNGQIEVTGHRPDVELANYLIAVVREALDSEFTVYQTRVKAVGYGGKSAFQVAMANRVSQRLRNMAAERKNEVRQAAQAITNQTDARALVIYNALAEKQEAVQAAFTAKFPKLSNTSGFSGSNNTTAHAAGRAAGDRVNLGRAIGGAQKRLG